MGILEWGIKKKSSKIFGNEFSKKKQVSVFLLRQLLSPADKSREDSTQPKLLLRLDYQ